MAAESKQEVIILNSVFYPEMVSSGKLMSELAVDLVAGGMSVSALCAQPSYYGSKRLASHIEHMGVHIHRGGTTCLPHRKMTFRMINSLTYILFVFTHLLFKKGKATLIVLTTPPFLLWIVWLLKIFRPGYRIVHLVHDIYPDVLAAGGMIGRRSPVFKLWRFLNVLFYRKTDKFVVIGRDMWQRVDALTVGKRKDDIVFIPNWNNSNGMAEISPKDNPLLKELSLDDRFVVQYSGNLGWCHDAGIFIEALSLLPEKACFLFIGGGRKRPALEKAAGGMDNITFLPFMDEDVVDVSQTACHAAMVSLAAGFSGLVVPCKLIGVLASGRPIIGIAEDDSEIARVIREEECGFVISPDDPRGLAEAVSVLMSDPGLCRRMGRNALAAYRGKYTREITVSMFRDLLSSLDGSAIPLRLRRWHCE
ncbi:MAG: glycosyltransferase family 4 protein [bacterium]|nr:glycosyltransferase family 4 protein [bacterium]